MNEMDKNLNPFQQKDELKEKELKEYEYELKQL